MGLRFFSSGIEIFSGGGGGVERFSGRRVKKFSGGGEKFLGVRNFREGGGVRNFRGGGVEIFREGLRFFQEGL